MKHNTKIVLMSAAGVLLSAGNALAAGNSSSTDVVGNLGIFSDLAGMLMNYSRWFAFLACTISLFFLLGMAGLGKVQKKLETSLNAKEGLKNWLIELVLVVVAFIILYQWAIPTINGFIP
jgi:hypothetical protein